MKGVWAAEVRGMMSGEHVPKKKNEKKGHRMVGDEGGG